MNEKIMRLAKESGLFDLPGIDQQMLTRHVEQFSEMMIEECVEQTKTELLQWLGHQAYSGSSHRTIEMGFVESPDWLSMDEIQKFMPDKIEKIKRCLRTGNE